ncbi:hypothetical protein Tco_0073889 [Tanacetum coccineum]
MGNREETLFWEDAWRGNNSLKSIYPRMFTLETLKDVTVAAKISRVDISALFHRALGGGIKEFLFMQLLKNMEGISLVDMADSSFPMMSSKTRWINVVPIKIDIHAWKVKLDSLPTRLNISKIAREIFRKILLWWDINVTEISSYKEWLEWLLSIHHHSKHKELLEGVCYVMWWYI